MTSKGRGVTTLGVNCGDAFGRFFHRSLGFARDDRWEDTRSIGLSFFDDGSPLKSCGDDILGAYGYDNVGPGLVAESRDSESSSE